MPKKTQTLINNPQLSDSSSKLIFGDNILSTQFFRDYADMEILRNIRPEDVEDVSNRYVPLFATERESDTVKRIDISKYQDRQKLSLEKNGEHTLPLYIVSLIEHKTKVEYNVIMQVLRYMVYIWEDYEKEMNKKYQKISRRKGFKYPPILPIIYYEGDENWTAPQDLSERIFCGELLGKYLPHFTYQLVCLRDYSNAELLKRGDEISLAMLINKIQNPEDMAVFMKLPGGQMDEILKNTPEYLLDTMAKLMRALLYKMNLPEEETEYMVARIKERKMSRLFDNVKMDIQEERRGRARAEEELDIVVKAFEIYKQVNRMIRRDYSEPEIKKALIDKFLLSEEEAEKAYLKAMEEF